MAFTLSQLEKLEEAIASGATVVRYADKTVEYRSLQEMMILRNRMRIDLAIVAPQNGGRFTFVTSKGLHSESDE
jgi:hypothetical protein